MWRELWRVGLRVCGYHTAEQSLKDAWHGLAGVAFSVEKPSFTFLQYIV